MKHLFLATVYALVLGLAASAQTMPGNAQPSNTDPSQTPNTTHPETSPSQTPDIGSGNSIPNTDKKSEKTKSEKTMKGCIESSSGQYMLTDKHGKQFILVGSQDFASHMGHTVNVHGTLGSGSDSSHSSVGMSGQDNQFLVAKLDMVSDKCSNKSKNSSKDTSNDNSKPSPNHK